MKPIPAAQFLTEFGSKTKPKRNEQPEQARKTPGVDKAPNIVEETFARGVAEGRAAASAEMEAKLEEQERFYEQKLELERCTQASRDADKFASQLDQCFHSIKTEISEKVASILKPFLMERARQAAMESLLAALETLLNKDQGVTLEISGPEDFLQLLREKLSHRNATAVFSPGGAIEVRVRVGQTVLETQLGVWLAKFEEIVG